MMDKMYIRDLEVECIIGTRDEERDAKQTLVINIELECDLSKAGESDDLTDTVNYSAIHDGVVEQIGASSYYLIEKVAAVIADICLAEQGVDAVTVAVDKPSALAQDAVAAVSIRRTKQG